MDTAAENATGVHIGCYFNPAKPKNVEIKEVGYGFSGSKNARKSAGGKGKDAHKRPPTPW